VKEKLCLIKKYITKDDVGQPVYFPVYNSDREITGKINSGCELLCAIHKPRNARHHKLIFALAKCVIANLPDEHFFSKASSYEFIKAVMIAEGITVSVYNLDGTKRLEPKSIAFESMCGDEFEKVSDAMFKWGAQLLNCTEKDLIQNYHEYL
jgi:hypothetical protein